MSFTTWTPTIVRFNESFSGGVLVEENPLAREYILLTLDVLAKLAFASHPGGGFGSGPQDGEIRAKLKEFVGVMAPRQFITPAAALRDRLKLFDIARYILVNAPKVADNTSYSHVFDHAKTNCEWFLLLAGTERSDGSIPVIWKRVIDACSDPTMNNLSSADLDILTTKVVLQGRKVAGLFVEEPFTVTSVDADGNMDLLVDRFIPDMDKPGSALSVAPVKARFLCKAGECKFVRDADGRGSSVETPLAVVHSSQRTPAVQAADGQYP
jgi:hypothetical protein